jgi:hypothetical protein
VRLRLFSGRAWRIGKFLWATAAHPHQYFCFSKLTQEMVYFQTGLDYTPDWITQRNEVIAARACGSYDHHATSVPVILQLRSGASVLLAISREFGKSVDWLLTGEEKK